LASPLAWLSTDGKKLLVTRILRTFAYGYLTVVIALYLAQLGLDTIQVGLVLSAAILGSALMTVVWALAADRYGRRRTVATMAVLMVAGGLLFAFGSSFWVLLLGAFTGTISATTPNRRVPHGRAGDPPADRSARTTHVALLHLRVRREHRTGGGFALRRCGRRFVALGLVGADAYRPALPVRVHRTLEPRDLPEPLGEGRRRRELRASGVSLGPSVQGDSRATRPLFGLDAFAGGLVVQSLVAYWFFVRWGFDPGQLAILFFFVNILSGISLLAAGWLASRIGLINTMVFTHLPSNILLLLVPLMPLAGSPPLCSSPDEHLADGCADATVLHDGRRRSRHAPPPPA